MADKATEMTGWGLERVWGAAGAMTLCCVLWATLGAGCAKALFDPREPRSQYERYDAVRNQSSETWVFDEFGKRRPNLRGRLEPKR